MGKTGPLIKGHYETLAAFRYALLRFIRFSEAAAEAAGVTGHQYQALLAIKGFPAREKVTVGELAERLQLRHHSAVGLIDRLVAEKLVVRRASSDDRRQVFIEVTRRGEKILEMLASVHRRQLKRIGPEISRLLGRLGGSEDSEAGDKAAASRIKAPAGTRAHNRHTCRPNRGNGTNPPAIRRRWQD